MNELKNFIIYRIFTLNDERSWSVNQLANESDITQSTLSNIISGKALPNIKTIDAICNAYNISISRFFQGYKAKTFDVIIEEDEALLLDYYHNVSKKEQELLIRIIKEFVDFHKVENQTNSQLEN